MWFHIIFLSPQRWQLLGSTCTIFQNQVIQLLIGQKYWNSLVMCQNLRELIWPDWLPPPPGKGWSYEGSFAEKYLSFSVIHWFTQLYVKLQLCAKFNTRQIFLIFEIALVHDALYASSSILGKNIARVQNCPDVTILNSLSVLCLFVFFPFCLFIFVVFLYFCLFVFLSVCLFCLFVSFVFLSFCLFVFLSFCLDSDQMSEGSQVSKVTLCVKILKVAVSEWLSDWVTDQGQV